jgi:hypothetical protein
MMRKRALLIFWLPLVLVAALSVIAATIRWHAEPGGPISLEPEPARQLPGPAEQTPLPEQRNTAPAAISEPAAPVVSADPATAQAPAPGAKHDQEAAAPTAAPPRSAPSAPEISDAAAAVLREHAAARIKAGDIPSARLILSRVYERRDPLAALTLGETYDPLVLKRQNANTVSFYANVDEARKWYGRAADLGSADAVQRMKELAELGR